MDDQAELRLKVLELAREMLHNSYVETKARMHNEWALKSDITWKTTQRVLPYPALPDYFTESDVLRKVVPLWTFVRDGDVTCQLQMASMESVPQMDTMHQPPPEPDPQMESTTHVVPTHAVSGDNQTTHMEIPQPVVFPSESPFTASLPPMPVAQPTPEPESAWNNRGLKVLPAWMTSRRG